MIGWLERWHTSGAISGAQYEVLSALVRKDRFSVFVELNTTLYLGVLAFVAGVGWTIETHFASLGDAAILSALTLTFCFSIYYCFSRGLPYSNRRVEPSGFAFDYVLYLGCLVFAIELGIRRIPVSHPASRLGQLPAPVGCRVLHLGVSFRQPFRAVACAFDAGGLVQFAAVRLS